jgi:hypothetical protein
LAAARTVQLKDLTSPAGYDRDGKDLASRGLYLDLPPWGYHVFALTIHKHAGSHRTYLKTKETAQ